jgi:hypothetical protein
MPVNLDPAEFYRREAERLRSMAASDQFDDVRDNLVAVAHLYDVLAGQADGLQGHRFGTAFIPASGDRRSA